MGIAEKVAAGPGDPPVQAAGAGRVGGWQWDRYWKPRAARPGMGGTWDLEMVKREQQFIKGEADWRQNTRSYSL